MLFKSRDNQTGQKKFIKLLYQITSSDLAHPSTVHLTVHIVPRATCLDSACLQFSTRFNFIFVVWLVTLPVLEMQLQQ